MGPDKPAVRDVARLLDNVDPEISLARAAMWGADRGTAPADRWERAAASLQAAAARLNEAIQAYAAMEKLEPYCTLCGNPLLNRSQGWAHFTSGDYEPADADHKPEMDWRLPGTPGRRDERCTACHVEAAGEFGLCWSCEDEEAEDA
jgi:hypothetical protein